MRAEWIVPLIVVIAAIPIVAWLVQVIAEAGRRRRLAGAPTSTVKGLTGGSAKVRGRLVSLGQALEGPVSLRPCAYYWLRVRQHVQHSPFSRGWKTIIDDAVCVACGVED